MVERDEASAPFFEALRRGELVVRHCAGSTEYAGCGALAAPAVHACPKCAATALGWKAVSGTGTLISWTVPRDRTGAITAVGGIVELAEGPWLRARLDGDPANFRAGLRMTMGFRRDGSEHIPVFQPGEGKFR